MTEKHPNWTQEEEEEEEEREEEQGEEKSAAIGWSDFVVGKWRCEIYGVRAGKEGRKIIHSNLQTLCATCTA